VGAGPLAFLAVLPRVLIAALSAAPVLILVIVLRTVRRRARRSVPHGRGGISSSSGPSRSGSP
jgi:hypothetical protein